MTLDNFISDLDNMVSTNTNDDNSILFSDARD